MNFFPWPNMVNWKPNICDLMASVTIYYGFSDPLDLSILYTLTSGNLFPSSLVIPLWRAFLMRMKGARSKVPLSGHFKWLSQCQDWFTKIGCHSRILKLETWNFAWDLILPIHMLYKKRGSIWKLFENWPSLIVKHQDTSH